MSIEFDTKSRLREVAERVLGSAKVVPIGSARKVAPQPALTVKLSGDSQISGNTIIGNGNTMIVRPAHPKVVVKVTPGAIHITDAQAGRLQQLVRDIAATGSASHQKVWGTLQRRYTVPQYRLIPEAAFTDAEEYLVRWIARIAPPAIGDDRGRHIRFIKMHQRKLSIQQNELTAFLNFQFKKKSLSECTSEELQVVRRSLVPLWIEGGK